MVIASGDPAIIAMGADGLPVALGPLAAIEDGDQVIVVNGADGLPVAAGPLSAITEGDQGVIVQGADGLPVFVKLASGCPDGSPSIFISVTGETEGLITWMGYSWYLPDMSGVEVEICPNFYSKKYGTGQFYGLDLIYGFEYWMHEYGTPSLTTYETRPSLRKLILIRYGQSVDVSGVWYGAQQAARVRFADSFYGGHYPSEAIEYVSLGLSDIFYSPSAFIGFVAGDAGKPSDYRILNKQFSSLTFDGVTYSWTRGNNWDLDPPT